MQQNKTKPEFNHASNSENYAKPLLCETLGATSNVAKTNYYLCTYFGLQTHRTLMNRAELLKFKPR